MQAVTLGLVPVPTPGTPVGISATRVLCNRIRFETTTAGAGKVYLGLAGLVKASLAGVIKQFIPAGSGVPDSFDLFAPDGADELDLSQYFVDAANAGEGL